MLPNRREALKRMAAGMAAIVAPGVVPVAAAPVAAMPYFEPGRYRVVPARVTHFANGTYLVEWKLERPP